MKKSGIGPVLASVIPGLIAGLSKKNRDKETPKKAGTLRDIGVISMAGAAASQTFIDCSVYGLEDQYCSLVHGIALIAGFLFYFFGSGKTKENERPETDSRL